MKLFLVKHVCVGINVQECYYRQMHRSDGKTCSDKNGSESEWHYGEDADDCACHEQLAELVTTEASLRAAPRDLTEDVQVS